MLSTLSYEARVGRRSLWGLQSGIVAIWDTQSTLKHFSGITTQISRYLPIGRFMYRFGGIIGNVKNCWETGAEVRWIAQGERVGLAIAARYSYFVDSNTGGMDFLGVGVTINYKII